MADNEKVLGPFQEAAKKFGFSKEIYTKLSIWWPTSEEGVKDALRKAGYTHEQTLGLMAKGLWGKRND